MLTLQLIVPGEIVPTSRPTSFIPALKNVYMDKHFLKPG